MSIQTQPKPFNLELALDSWEKRYPNKQERIAILREELRHCEEQRRAKMGTSCQQRVSYPITIAAIQEMLEVLEK